MNANLSNQELGTELNQFARFLFNSAANNWYMSIALEMIAGLFAAVISAFDLTGDFALVGASLGTVLFVIAYFLRLEFDSQYDIAETMRRQSLLTEALDWPIGKVQMSEWRRQVGRKIREKVKNSRRSENYYATQQAKGPRRLAEMIIESAFYTRHLYAKLNQLIWIAFIASIVLLALIASFAFFTATPNLVDYLIAKTVFSVIAVLLAIDLLGLGLKVRRLLFSISKIEENLEQLSHDKNLGLPQVLSLVAEYNCQVAAGVPIHDKLFALWHDETNDLWLQNRALQTK